MTEPRDGDPHERPAGRVGRNIVALVVARGVTMAMTLATTAYAARVLMPEGLGTLGFAIALVSYFTLLGSLGLDVLGTREIARDRSVAAVRSLVSSVVSLRVGLGVVALILYAGLVAALPRAPAFQAVLWVQGLVLVGQAVSLEWVYQGLERMGTLAVRNVIAGVLQLVLTVVLVRDTDDAVWAACAQVAAVAAVSGGLVASYWREVGPLRLRVDPARWRALVREALPFAASLLMVAVYYNLDKLLLGVLRTEAEVGLYEAAYRIVMLALVPGQILYQAFFPSLAASHGDLDAMRASGRAYARATLGVGLPVALGGALLAGPLVALVAGPGYEASVAPLVVLMANVAMVNVNMSVGQALLAWNQQRPYLWAVGTGAFVNLALNLVLIPRFGPLGAAWATLAAEGAVFGGLAVTHYRTVGQLYPGVLARAAVAAGLGVGGGVLGARALGAPWPVEMAAAVVGYGVAALALGVVRPSDWRRSPPELGRSSQAPPAP